MTKKEREAADETHGDLRKPGAMEQLYERAERLRDKLRDCPHRWEQTLDPGIVRCVWCDVHRGKGK